MECQIELNKQNCSCNKQSCDRHGKCCDCVLYHRQTRSLPKCFFNGGHPDGHSYENFACLVTAKEL